MIRAMMGGWAVLGTMLVATLGHAQPPGLAGLEGVWVGRLETSYGQVDRVLQKDGMSLPLRLMLVPYVRWQISKCEMKIELKGGGAAVVEVSGSDSIHVESDKPTWTARQIDQDRFEVTIVGQNEPHIWQAELRNEGNTLMVSGDSWQSSPFQVTRFERKQ